jgi:hypothetical protein
MREQQAPGDRLIGRRRIADGKGQVVVDVVV